MQIVFATNNAHKLEEVRRILGPGFEVLSLNDIDCHDDIPETGKTFEENALQKASWVAERYGVDCFADDSGLEVDALGGAPGVLSARYAGTHGDDEANNALVLKNLEGVTDRRGRFRCAIALVRRGHQPRFFSAAVEGTIGTAPAGDGGFGYDPLFTPLGWTHTFAEGTADDKHAISHRGKAVKAMADFLTTCK